MWAEYMKRWLNLWLWWLPRERQEAERESARPAPATSDEPSENAAATTSSVTTPTASHEPPVAPDRDAEPETTPAPEPQTAAEAPASGEPAPAPPTEPDNLTEIKGIGPAVQEKLQALGIATYADLAKADADWLTGELKSRQVVISQVRVQQWITAARDRA